MDRSGERHGSADDRAARHGREPSLVIQGENGAARLERPESAALGPGEWLLTLQRDGFFPWACKVYEREWRDRGEMAHQYVLYRMDLAGIIYAGPPLDAVPDLSGWRL